MNHFVRQLLALLVAAVLLGNRAEAQSTYTWANSNVAGTPASPLDWFTGGPNTQGTWQGGTPVSGSANTIKFFADTTTALTNTGTPSSQTVNLNNGGTAFQLGTLTLAGLASTTTNANLTMTLQGDALNFSGAAGTINLDALNNTRTVTYNVNNAIQLGTGASNTALTIGGTGSGTFVLGGIISELKAGGGSLIKNGASAVSLTGANTFSGGVTLNAGTLRLGNAAALGTGTFTITGGSIDATSALALDNNAQNWSGNFTFAGSNALNLGTGAVRLIGTAARTVTVTSSTLTVGGVISGTSSTAGLTKAGVGVLSLDAANTYTGVTTVSAGVLLLNNANALPGGIGATGGTSNLTFNAGIVGLTGNFTRSLGAASTASAVTFTGNGGWAAFGADRTVNLGGNATPSSITWATANTGFNGKTLLLGAAAATHTVELVNPIDLGASVTRTVTVGNGSADFDAKMSGNLTGSGTLTAGGGGMLLLTGSNSFGGLVIGTPVAVSSANALGSGTLTLANTGALASTSPTPLTIANPIVTNWTQGSGARSTFGNAAATGDLVLSGGLFISAGGTLTDNSYTEFSLAGLTNVDIRGAVSGSAPGYFGFNVGSGKTLRLGADNSGWTMNKVLANSGTFVLGHAKALGSGTVSFGLNTGDLPGGFVYSEIDLTGTNALTNAIVLNRIGGNVTGGWNNVTFSGVKSIELAGNVDFTVGLRTLTNSISDGSLVMSGTVILSSAASSSPSKLAGTGNTLVSGNIIGGSGTTGFLAIDGPGTTTLAGTNTYVGTTAVNGGVLLLSTTAAISGTAARPYSVTGPGTLAAGYALDQALIDKIGTNAVGVVALGANSANNLDVTQPNGVSLGAVGSATRVYSGTLTQTTTYRLGGGGGTLDFQSPLTGGNALIVGGPTTGLGGAVILAGTNNSFTGKTTVQNGTLSIASLANVSGGNSTLGAPTTTANGTIDLGSGTTSATLRYVGTTSSTSNRVINLVGTTGGATLEAAGSGALVLTSAFTATGSGAKTLTLTGTSTAANTLSGAIPDAAGSTVVSLNKTGAGRWVLSGSNGFTGSTTVGAGTLDFSSINALRNTSGVSIASGAGLQYSGGAASFDRNISVTSGTGTVTNSGGGLLTLAGTLTKNGTILRLTGGQFNVTGQIVGADPGSDLVVDGTSTVTLSSANTYNGPTFVNQASNLIVNINNAIPSGSIITLGNATTTGTLSLGSFSNAIGGLSFGAGGGTLRMVASSTSAAPLTASAGTVNLDNGTLDLTGGGTSAGLYRLISAQTVAGTLSGTTGASAAYQLLTTSSSVNYQQRAVLGAVSVTNPAAAIITGGSAAFTYTVTNNAFSGGADLAFSSGSPSNIAGTSSGNAAAGGSSSLVSGLVFTGTSVGAGRNGTFAVNAPSAFGSTTASGTVSVDVYDHASGSATGATIALADSIVGYTGSLAGLTSATISNAAGYRVNLMTTGGTSAGFVNINNVSGVSAGSAAQIYASAGLNGTQAVGANTLGQTFNLTYADNSNLNGVSNNLGSEAITVTGRVLDHATSSLGASLLTSTTVSLGTYNYSTNTWESGGATGFFDIYNLASAFGASLTADLSLVNAIGAGDGFTTNLASYADIAGGQSQQFSIFFNPTGITTNRSTTFTISMSDKTGMAGATASNTLFVTANVIVVPEPAGLALLASAAITGWAVWKRRRR